MTQNLQFGTLSWLRTMIDRIEREIELYEGDQASTDSGNKILKLANETLRRAERLYAKDPPHDYEEVEAIRDSINRIKESQWGMGVKS